MSEADYLSSIDTYWADKYSAECEKMRKPSKPKTKKEKSIKNNVKK